MLTWLSRHVFYPLWDAREGGLRLKTMRQLDASQWRSTEDILNEQWQKAIEVVRYAYAHCPYYKRSFDSTGVSPDDIGFPHDLIRLPLLSKKDVQKHVDELISNEYSKDALVQSRTGGSTGTALTVYCDPACRETRNGAALRADRWAGWNLGEKVAAIWGNPPIADTLKKKLRNFLHDRIIYLDTMNLTDETLRDFALLCSLYRPSLVFGHSHSIFAFAQFLDRTGIPTFQPRAIVSTSMMLLEPERKLIERVFHCAVTNRYGCEEVGLIACQCERHSAFHVNAEHVLIEYLGPDGSPADSGQQGEIVVTDLLNRGMPLIRYRVGDVGVPSDGGCSCGRGLPLMERITGRTADFLIRPDASLIAGVSLVERTLTAIPGLDQMQLVQESIERIQINIVPLPEYNEASKQRLLAEMSTAFGPGVSFEIQCVPALPQEDSGKYRFSICKLRGAHHVYR